MRFVYVCWLLVAGAVVYTAAAYDANRPSRLGLQPLHGCDIRGCFLHPHIGAKRRRCLTMLNRWQAHKGATCGEVAPIIMCLEVAQHCSTSSTPNDSEVSAPRRLRYRSTSGYAWFAISDGTSSLRSPLRHRIALLHNTSLQSLGVLPYTPTASQHISHRCPLRAEPRCSS